MSDVQTQKAEAVDVNTDEILKNDQDVLIGKLNDIVDNIADEEGTEVGRGARLAIGQVLEVVDGKDGGNGYFVISKTSGMLEGPDLAGNLSELFEGINS